MLAVKPKLASRQKTSFDAIRVIAVAHLVADLHQKSEAANDDTASAQSLYAYAHHNPLKYTDPTGTSSISYSDFGGTSGMDLWTQNALNLAQQDSNRQFNSAPIWNDYNASASLSASGGGGLALTNNNTNWNAGGMNGLVNPMNNIGAGVPTGLPARVGNSTDPFLGPILTGASLGVDASRSMMSMPGIGIAQGANGPYSMSLNNGNVAISDLNNMSKGLEVAGRGLFGLSAVNDINDFRNGHLSGGRLAANLGVGASITFGGLNAPDALAAGAIYEAGKWVSDCGPCMDVLTEPYFIP